MLSTPLPLVNDTEGSRVPDGMPPVADAHVHLFPDPLFDAIWNWFDRYGWPIRYRLKSPDIIDFLLERGVAHIVGFLYAHRPGVARDLNAYMANLVSGRTQVTGLATVMPGEPDAVEIVEEGFAMGLEGVKLHAHVQCFEMISDAMEAVYDVCARHGKPLVMHVGREPKSPAYPCDPHEICHAWKLERVLKNHPDLRVLVPHLGADEFEEYADLIERYDNLWLDTSVACADYLPVKKPVPSLNALRADRVLYGSDFPNIPYAWDREIRRISSMGLPEERLEALFLQQRRGFFLHPGP